MEIKFSKSARQCTGCQIHFVHEQRIMSAVRRAPEGWLREDYCPVCWTDDRAALSLCVWSAQFQDPQVLEQQPAEAFSPLRQVFYESAERRDRQSIAVAYLAGQLLRRQKIFRFIKQTIDPETESAVLMFLDRIGNRLIEVNDPNLTTGELERGRVDLLHRLAEIEGTLDDAEPEQTETQTIGSDDGETETENDGKAQDEYAQA